MQRRQWINNRSSLMKAGKFFFFVFLVGFGVFRCSAPSEQPGNGNAAALQQQLDSLYQLRAAIDVAIQQLEQQLGMAKRIRRAKNVALYEVQPQPFEHWVTFTGEVVSKKDVMLTPKMSGVVEQVLVTEGRGVKKGQVLARLDASVIRRQIEQVKTALDFARVVYRKQKRVWEEKAGSEIRYLEAKNRVEVLEKQLATLQSQLALSEIRAPFSGVIDAVFVKVGEAALVGRPAFRLVRPDDLQIRAEVAERFATAFSVGQRAQVVIPDLQDTFRLKVAAISRSVDAKDRTVQIFLPFHSSVPGLRTHMLALVTLRDYAKDSALVVPLKAVQRFEDTEFVFVAVQRKGQWVAEKRTVRTGKISGGSVEVLEGLRPGERVIVEGVQDIAAGDYIAVQ